MNGIHLAWTMSTGYKKNIWVPHWIFQPFARQKSKTWLKSVRFAPLTFYRVSPDQLEIRRSSLFSQLNKREEVTVWFGRLDLPCRSRRLWTSGSMTLVRRLAKRTQFTWLQFGHIIQWIFTSFTLLSGATKSTGWRVLFDSWTSI